MERALLKIERAGWIKHKAIACVMRVGRVHAADDPGFDVVSVIAVGVFQVQNVWALRHDHTLTPEFKADWVVQVAGKRLHRVGGAIAVGVFENEELIVHGLIGPPVWVGGPRCHPQTPFAVKAHLHRVDEFGKHRFVGHQFDLHARMHRHFLDRFLPREKLVLAPLQRPGLIGHNRNQLGQPNILDRRERGVGIGQRGRSGPDSTVAVGRLHIQIIQLALAHLVVGLAIHKLEPRPTTVCRVAVRHAIAVEPEEILVHNRSAETLEALWIAGWVGTEERLIDDP